MSSAEKMFNFVFIVKTISAWTHCAVFAAVLAGLFVTLVTEARAGGVCGTGWEPVVPRKKATGRLQEGVRLSGSGRYFRRLKLDLQKGQKLTIRVGSRDFRPRVVVYRKKAGKDLRVAYHSGNPAVIKLNVLAKGKYIIVVTTHKPGKSGRFDYEHTLCRQEEKASGRKKEGKPCSNEWKKGKANYRVKVDEFYKPEYQGVCTLGSCGFAGTDRATGYKYKTGYWTFSKQTGWVEIYRELYVPRLDKTFFCKDKN